MKQTTCEQCQKQIEERDLFHLDYNELIDPITNEFIILGRYLCLECYRQTILHQNTTKAYSYN